MAITIIEAPKNPSHVLNRIKAEVETDQYTVVGVKAVRVLKFTDYAMEPDFISFEYNNKILKFTARQNPIDSKELQSNDGGFFGVLLDFVNSLADSLLKNYEWLSDFRVTDVTEVASNDVRMTIEAVSPGDNFNFEINGFTTDITGLTQFSSIIGTPHFTLSNLFILGIIFKGNSIISELEVVPDSNNRAVFNLDQFLLPEFSAIPRYADLSKDVFEVEEFFQKFTLKAAEVKVGSSNPYGILKVVAEDFAVFYGHFDFRGTTWSEFMQQYMTATVDLKFFTNQPRRKIISTTQPEALYLFQNVTQLRVHAQFIILTEDVDGHVVEGDTIEVEIRSAPGAQGKVICVPCGYGQYPELAAHHSGVEPVYGYDFSIVLKDAGAMVVATTEKFKFIVDHDDAQLERIIAFKENSPSIGYLRCLGDKVPADEFEASELLVTKENPNNAEFGELRNFNKTHSTKFKLSVGYANEQEYIWMKELLTADDTWLLEYEQWQPISIQNKKLPPFKPGAPTAIELVCAIAGPAKAIVPHA